MPAASNTASEIANCRPAPASPTSNTSSPASVRASQGFVGNPPRESTPALNQDSLQPVKEIEASGAWKMSAARRASSANCGGSGVPHEPPFPAYGLEAA